MEQSLRNFDSSINNVNAKVQMKMANNDFASVENTLWGKVKQMQPMQQGIFPGRPFEATF